MKRLDALIVGVGGQGVIMASDTIGEAALAAGYDVKKTDTLGMAQRGGSVVSHLRMAPKVWSPLARKGQVDILLAFEKLEAARWVDYLCPEGIALVNDQALPPLAVNLGRERYPSDDEIIHLLNRRTDKVYFIEGTKRARELGNVRTLNMFMLGCVSNFMPFKVSIWKDSISGQLAANIREINLNAFSLGRKEIRDGHRETWRI